MFHPLFAVAAAAAVMAPSGTPGDSEIVVEGHKLTAHEISQAVEAVGQPSSNGGFETQFARWDGPICIGVAGMAPDDGQYIADRLGAIARDLHIRAELPGCHPNILIVVTSDPSTLIREARLQRPSLVSGLAPALLDRLARNNAAVRVVSSHAFTSADGDPAIAGDFASAGQKTVTLHQWHATHLLAPTQTHLSSMTVIVDKNKMAGLNYQQIAAYLSMVAFAEINVGAQPSGVRTILSLFSSGDDLPQDLTAFDQAYLRALYAVDPRLSGDQQRSMMAGSIQRIMADTLRKSDASLRATGGESLGSGPEAMHPQHADEK